VLDRVPDGPFVRLRQEAIPVGIASFGAQFTVPYGAYFAASVIAVAPIAALVVIFRKSVVSGLTAGAVKG
jgi:multiple sugar transport system permease protein